MSNRKQQLEELMEAFHTMRKRMFFRDAGSKARVSPEQWMTLRVIAFHSDCTIKDIAEHLHISSSAATQLVDKLVASGYVTRKENAEDRRAVTVALSEKSADEVANLRAKLMERMTSVFEALSDDELEKFVDLSKKIAAKLPKKENT